MERLKRFTPPGMDLKGIRFWTIGAIVFSTFFSMMFLMEYNSELYELKRKMEYPVYAGLTMTPFVELVYSPMAVFRLAPIVPLLFSIINCSYFYEETKSIFVMKRLRSPWALPVRCVALPLLGAIVVIAAGCAVYGIYYLIYYTCTPEILLPAAV